MVFAKMEDNLSNIEVLVFPRLLEENKDIWQEEKIIALKGKLTDKEGIPKIIAQSVAELNPSNINSVLLGLKSQNNDGNKFYYRKKEKTDQASGPTNSINRFMDIKMPKTVKKESLIRIKDIFKGKSGETKVRFVLDQGNGNKIINTSFSISPNDAQEVRKKLFFIVGGNNVLLK